MARKKRSVPASGVDPDTQDQGGEETTAQRVLKNWKISKQHLGKWKEESRESFDFVAGRQWDQADIDILTEQQRQVITFNRTGTTIDAVSGYEINGRQDVTFMPRTTEDNGPAEVESDAARYFREQCDAEDEESDAFHDLLTCGIGVVEHRMDFDDDPEGMLKVERCDPLEFGWDPASKKRNLMDRRWDIRGEWIDRDKAKDTWPKAEFASTDPSQEDDEVENRDPVKVPENAFYRSGSGEGSDKRRNKVFILEMTWFELEPYYSVANPQTGALEDLKPDEHDKLQTAFKERGMEPLKSVKRTKKAYKRAFVHGQELLEEGPAPCPDMFQYQFMTGKRDRNKNWWYGLVRAMKDPQRWANKWMSQQLHIINSNVKGGIDYEEGAFDDVGEVERKQARPGAVLKINAGYMDKVRRVEPTQIPQNVFQLMEFAITSIRDVTGVNVELLGTADRNQPGVLETQRKQSAMAILAPLFDSQRRYRKNAGRLTLYFIQEFLSDGRLVRIVGEGDAKYVPLTKDKGFTDYDVIVDEAPTSPNQKEAAFGSIMQVMPALMKMGIQIPPEVLEYVPGLPQKLVDTWKKLLSEPNPEANAKKILEGLKMLAEVEKDASQSELNKAKALQATGGLAVDATDTIGQLMLAAKAAEAGQIPGQQPAAPPMAMPPQQPAAQPPPAVSPPSGPPMGAAPPQGPVAQGPMPMPQQSSPFAAHFPAPPDPMEQGLAKMGDAIGQGLAQMGADMKAGLMALAQINAAPTELVRDAKGKAIGAQKRMATQGTLQ